jgi:hypothetical protein
MITPVLQDSFRIPLDSLRQDSARVAAPSDSARAAMPEMPMPEMRPPQNEKFLIGGYSVAAAIYALYLVILFRRWSALRQRQQDQPHGSRQ